MNEQTAQELMLLLTELVAEVKRLREAVESKSTSTKKRRGRPKKDDEQPEVQLAEPAPAPQPEPAPAPQPEPAPAPQPEPAPAAPVYENVIDSLTAYVNSHLDDSEKTVVHSKGNDLYVGETLITQDIVNALYPMKMNNTPFDVAATRTQLPKAVVICIYAILDAQLKQQKG